MPRTYIVGRSTEADLRVPSHADSVGKLHLEITLLSEDEVCLTDRKTQNGTFIKSKGEWREIQGSEHVSVGTEVMLGEYRTTVRELLSLAVKAPPPPPVKRRVSPDREVQRNKVAPPPPPPPAERGYRRGPDGEIIEI